MEMIIIYPVFIGIALATAQLAHQKGYKARWWFLLGLVLPIVSTMVLFSMRKREKSRTGFHAPVLHKTKDKILFKR
jgi:hypothetical protein